MANSTSLESLSRNLAHNLQELRKRRQLSQASLSKLAELPRSTVANLESGAGNPSLFNLVRLSGALQVPIEELLTAPRAHCKLVEANKLPVSQRIEGSAYIYKLLPDPVPGMEMDRLEIEPGTRMGGIPHTVGTKEYLTCLQGELTVHVGGDAYKVNEGDVLAFPGELTHSYQNTGTCKAVGLSVVALTPMGL